ncbi:ABC transporter ATP-binding protein [Chloroflexi bacterium]|nr:macrolide ABC transporter ATP-binding protein [Chloroflexota bacterium]MDC0252942.1 ABC transporter ATP-binding protein [Chloroflexota bacterium]OUW96119.1 MAG: macrolide ABC transporter ATP-binding protein [Chloroflexi bacterium TMED230]RZP12979.1 MAG: ABC transporter ATP-binding protein [Chloroflexota bacterium]|tara:strand:- start:2817 stop:3476 length:660 start_codon:yes stop_codon:yes gene_type:complete
MIELKEVSKIFDTGFNKVNALSNVDIKIDQGEFVAIKGPSGSGKSTMMNIIGLLDRPSHGKYLLGNNDVSTLNDNKRSLIRGNVFGFVFQNYNLIPRLSAVRQVEMPLIYRKDSERRKKSIIALTKLGLAERISHSPVELSGGEQQRVSIARALVGQPKIILADEPTGALDSKTGEEIIQIFKSLSIEGITVIMITHDHLVAQKASRIIEMKDGMVVQE